MDIASVVAERRIREAQERGEFENLEGRGKPITDIDRVREDGWWAIRKVRVERAKDRRTDDARS